MQVPMGCDKKSIFHGVVNFAIVHQIKPLARQLLRLADKLLDEPDYENTIRPNSHVMVDIMHYFFSKENNPGRAAEFRGLWKLGILIPDGDLYYYEREAELARVLYEKMVSGEWDFNDPPPRHKWWGHEELCPNCGQIKGSQRVFADCPDGMHIEINEFVEQGGKR